MMKLTGGFFAVRFILCIFVYVKTEIVYDRTIKNYAYVTFFSSRREGEEYHEDQILSKAVKAGRRTYFFDVRATRGDDYFLTITESRKTVDAEGKTTYDRHKIFLYKEDFDKFVHGLSETLDYIRSHRPMPEPELQE